MCKLGYGGTKTEMERLIADANEYASTIGEASDLSIDSFSDIVDAIDLIQRKQQIQGTSQREALSTIEGSANAAKASWSNFLTAVGSGDLEKVRESTQGIIVSLFGTWDDELQRKSGGLVNNVLPILDNIKTALLENIPSVAESLGYQFVQSFMGALGFDNAEIDDVLLDLEERIATFRERVETIIGLIGDTWSGFAQGFGGTVDLSGAEGALDNAYEAITGILGFIADNADTIGAFVGNITTLMGSLSEGLGNGFLSSFDFDGFADGLDKVREVIEGVVSFFAEHGEEIGTIFGNVASALGHVFNILMTFVGTVWPVLEPIVSAFIGFIKDISDKLKELVEWADENLPKFMEGVREKFEEITDFFENLPQNISNALGSVGDTLLNAGKNIMDGFFKGIQQGWEDITGFFGGVGDWIAEHKGPKSYDLRLLIPNGEWIMQSLNEGLMNGLPRVEKTLRGITGEIESGINTNVSLGAVKPQSESDLMSMLAQIRDGMSMDVYLDGDRLVGGIATRMDTAMGRL